MRPRGPGEQSVEQRIINRRNLSGPSNDKWLTTFNDLITLMMVFFVLLFAMSKGDMEKSRNSGPPSFKVSAFWKRKVRGVPV
jgi:flagellar motor protein MotB